MFLSGLLSLLSKLLFFTGRVETKNAFEKPLSSKEEKEYFLKMKAGDKKAEEKLIRHNLRLVAHIIKKYYSFDDSESKDSLKEEKIKQHKNREKVLTWTLEMV